MLVSTNEILRIEISENDGEVLCSKISFRYLYLILGNPELISKKPETRYSSVNTSSVSTLTYRHLEIFKKRFFQDQ